MNQPCARCGTTERPVYHVLSFSNLLFGGFLLRYEYRCQKCENEVSKRLFEILDQMKRDNQVVCNG